MSRRGVAVFVRSVALAGCAAASAGAAGAQTISISGVPDYGALGSVTGSVGGVDPAAHRVAAFIHIEGSGWWTKPTLASPTVGIDAGGAFEVDVGTGGPSSLDSRAVVFCTALIPAAVTPETASGATRIPASLAPLAIDCEQRYGRTLWFSGLEWGVKESPLPVGPGANVFSDREEDVFVDAEGRLHLRIAFHDGKWWSAELVLLHSLGYGSYWVHTDSPLDVLDPNATFGVFLWDLWGDETSVPGSPNREIDVEDSRWTDVSDPTSSQAVVQPAAATPQNLHRYALPDLSGDARVTRALDWAPDAIRFLALRGHHWPSSFAPGDVIDEYAYIHAPAEQRYVPTAGRETLRIALWLNHVELGGAPPPHPAGGEPVEVIVERIAIPEPERWLLHAAGIGCLGLLARRRRPSPSD